MGSGKRSLTTVTMALACAAAILSAPGVAYADPSPSPTPTPTPPPSSTSASLKDLEAIRKKLEKLYHDAAVATDAYNAAEEKTEKQSAQIVALARTIVKGQARLDKLKDRAGAAARAQYRGGGLPPEARLMLSDDPQQFLDGAGRVRQGEQATKGMLAEMARNGSAYDLAAVYGVKEVLDPRETRVYLKEMLDTHALRLSGGVGQHRRR